MDSLKEVIYNIENTDSNLLLESAIKNNDIVGVNDFLQDKWLSINNDGQNHQFEHLYNSIILNRIEIATRLLEKMDFDFVTSDNLTLLHLIFPLYNTFNKSFEFVITTISTKISIDLVRKHMFYIIEYISQEPPLCKLLEYLFARGISFKSLYGTNYNDIFNILNKSMFLINFDGFYFIRAIIRQINNEYTFDERKKIIEQSKKYFTDKRVLDTLKNNIKVKY